tara:strand:+ start:4182 stop:4625 length:444 start_codon:yes stop_codon:yes gene_type:complete
MDIYERLIQDHEKQRRLCAELMKTSGDSAERRKLFAELCEEVESHAAAEEQSFYAALIEKADGQDKARHSVAEHKEASDLIEELQAMDMGTGAWIQKFEKLKEDLVHHVDEEEEEVFPLAKKLIDAQRAENLADKFEERKAAERKAA